MRKNNPARSQFARHSGENILQHNLTHCTLCPRMCGADRTAHAGVCGADAAVHVARAMLHPWEEPPVSGTRGSGAVFFCGCPLHCTFCQNSEISRGHTGRTLSTDELAALFLRLEADGAHNINLVSPTPYIPHILAALAHARPALTVPIVYNTGGYERISTIAALDGYIDVYLPDVKFLDPALATRYCRAPDYFDRAAEALVEMVRQCGRVAFDEDGIIQHGVIIRHMVMPGARKDSIALLRRLAEIIAPEDVKLSLMCQYTPGFDDGTYPELSRRVTSFEYASVVEEAQKLGFDGYIQERGSQSAAYVPSFRGEGLEFLTETSPASVASERKTTNIFD